MGNFESRSSWKARGLSLSGNFSRPRGKGIPAAAWAGRKERCYDKLKSSTMKDYAPYAVASLVLGICSLVFACLFVGFVCGIIGLVLAVKGTRIYRMNPSAYSGYGMLNAGKILSIIGIALGFIYVIYALVVVFILGAGLFCLPFMTM